MPLVHKSIDVRAEVWKKLRLHAELSNCSLRDYLTYLIESSQPLESDDHAGRCILAAARAANSHAQIG